MLYSEDAAIPCDTSKKWETRVGKLAFDQAGQPEEDGAEDEAVARVTRAEVGDEGAREADHRTTGG